MTVSIIPSYGEGWCNVFRDGHLEKICVIFSQVILLGGKWSSLKFTFLLRNLPSCNLPWIGSANGWLILVVWGRSFGGLDSWYSPENDSGIGILRATWFEGPKPAIYHLADEWNNPAGCLSLQNQKIRKTSKSLGIACFHDPSQGLHWQATWWGWGGPMWHRSNMSVMCCPEAHGFPKRKGSELGNRIIFGFDVWYFSN